MIRAQIQRNAYLLWEKAGKPKGRDLEFWLQAEREHFDLYSSSCSWSSARGNSYQSSNSQSSGGYYGGNSGYSSGCPMSLFGLSKGMLD